ncbi:MAG: class I tRNA ligase family protein, partial [Roseovarius sp.]|nr:class I tRNA ligase family protein [Roseovarius sp.]
EGHVLFAVESYSKYGALSGRTVDDMIAGARVEVAPYKRNPMDFVLWKPSTPDLPGWDSPWGRGRPGWHIECSAMAYELLGESFDIHGGGNDLMFPHHENEIAQSCCAHPEGDFAKVWMHNEMLQVEGKKMSKSLGNFFTVRDLLDQGVPGEVIRYVFLRTHYRKPMNWTEKKAEEAKNKLKSWYSAVRGVEAAEKPSEIVVNALADDLNTSNATDALNASYDAKDFATLRADLVFLGLMNADIPEWAKFDISTLGYDVPDSRTELKDKVMEIVNNYRSSPEVRVEISRKFPGLVNAIQVLDSLSSEKAKSYIVEIEREFVQVGKNLQELKERLAKLHGDAKRTKDFTAVDQFKAELVSAGVEVRMSKDGVELIPGPNFDPSKLEVLK